MKGRISYTEIIGATIVVLTLILFHLGGERVFIDKFSIAMVVFAEVLIVAYTGIFAKKKGLFSNSGVISLLTIYLVSEVALYFLRISLFEDHMMRMIRVHFIVTAIVVVLVMIFLAVGRKPEVVRNDYLIQSQNKLEVYLKDDSLSSYHSSLNKLFEKIRYSNKGAHSGKEEQVFNNVVKMDELLKFKNDESIEMINELVSNSLVLVSEHEVIVKK